MSKFAQRGFSSVATIAIVAVVVVVAGWWWMKQSNAPIASVTPTTSGSASPNSSWKTYHNAQFGFDLTFTDQWRGYTVTNGTDLPGKTWVLVFNLKDSDGSDYPMFTITIYSKSYWQEIANNPDYKKPANILAQNNGYVFTSSAAQYAPENKALLNLNNTQILSTFKFTR